MGGGHCQARSHNHNNTTGSPDGEPTTNEQFSVPSVSSVPLWFPGELSAQTTPSALRAQVPCGPRRPCPEPTRAEPTR